MKTAFVTGITGQDGSYLAEFLLKKSYKVVGLVSSDFSVGNQNIEEIKDQLILEKGDLLNEDSLRTIIEKYQPSEIYNLAGLTFPPISWKKPTLVMDINTLGLARILEIIKDKYQSIKVYQASSSKIFGNPKVYPQNEKTEIAPNDPYAVSKAASHFLVQAYRRRFDLFLVSGILFNHESPRRGEEFVTRKITLTVAKIKFGLENKLSLGNLDAEQDWGYAPDYVEAMWLMLQQDKPEDFVIATGELHSVRDVCEIAFSYLGMDWKKYVKVDRQLFRKEEEKPLIGDFSLAAKTLGWKPKTPFKDMIVNMVQSDVENLKRSEK